MTEALLLVVIALQVAILALQLRARAAATAAHAPPRTPGADVPSEPLRGGAPTPAAQLASARWSEALAAASAAGWTPGLPDGPAVLAWAEEGGGLAAATRLVGALGRVSRAGLTPQTVESRDVLLRGILEAAAQLVDGLGDGLSLDVRPPGSVGPRHRHLWLVDEACARSLGQTPVAGVVQPRVVLRPALRHGEHVILEGEVA